MVEPKFSEEQMRAFSKEVVPAVEKVVEIAKKHGVDGGLRVWLSNSYVSIEGTPLGGWEMHKYKDKYEMTYNMSVPLYTEQEDADAK